ncbi:MAG: DUF4956 domain-containing protein [Planctomycetales bacterium]
MPDLWNQANVLSNSGAVEAGLSVGAIILRLLLALVFGAGVAIIYRLSHGRDKGDSRTLTTTLILLSVLIAMVSMVIGSNVARAFSLVGALSIVRFRTVVEDTRDTAFVIFAVIVGMAAGADLWMVPLVGLPMVGLAAVGLEWLGGFGTRPLESELNVRLGLGHDPELHLEEIFGRHLSSHRLRSVGTARQGAALDLTYGVRLRPQASLTALVTELNQREGVQGVEFKKL